MTPFKLVKRKVRIIARRSNLHTLNLRSRWLVELRVVKTVTYTLCYLQHTVHFATSSWTYRLSNLSAVFVVYCNKSWRCMPLILTSL
jgi:hypothetical protein